jgi:hypothetical protein
MWLPETIKALAYLAWPIVVAVIAFGYKPELMAFLPPTLRRKFKLELPGIKLEMEAAEQQQAAPDITTTSVMSGAIELKEISGLVRTPAIANVERDLHAILRGGIADPIDVLVRNLAQARLEAAFGAIYAVIFGSQIAGLKELGARRRVTNAEAHQFYLEIEKQNPEAYAGYGFSGWLGFLKNRGLIRQEGEDVVMTDLADDFLTWLQAARLTVNKPF